MEIAREIADIERSYKQYQITPVEAFTQEKALIEEQIASYEKYISTLKQGDATYQDTANALAGFRDRLTEVNEKLLEQSGTFSEGLTRGLQEYIRQLSTPFQQMRDLAKTTAESMQKSFEDFFFDAMEGKFKTFSDYAKSFLQSIEHQIAKTMSEKVMGGIMQVLFPSLTGAATGVPKGTLNDPIYVMDISKGSLPGTTQVGSSTIPEFPSVPGESPAPQSNFLQDIWQKLTGVFNSLVQTFSSLFSGLGKQLGGLFSGFISTMGGLFSWVGNNLSSLFNDLLKIIANLFSSASSSGGSSDWTSLIGPVISSMSTGFSTGGYAPKGGRDCRVLARRNIEDPVVRGEWNIE